MNIRLRIDVILKDEIWGFSDLLGGRNLDDKTKKEIVELIQEDIGELRDTDNWKISEENPVEVEILRNA